MPQLVPFYYMNKGTFTLTISVPSLLPSFSTDGSIALGCVILAGFFITILFSIPNKMDLSYILEPGTKLKKDRPYKPVIDIQYVHTCVLSTIQVNGQPYLLRESHYFVYDKNDPSGKSLTGFHDNARRPIIGGQLVSGILTNGYFFRSSGSKPPLADGRKFFAIRDTWFVYKSSNNYLLTRGERILRDAYDNCLINRTN